WEVNQVASTVLVTGGTGFIGSHTTVALQKAGYRVVILDNLHNSHAYVVDNIAKITGIRPAFIQGDVRDPQVLASTFRQYTPDAVLHFAGVKAVGESTALPLVYYDNNVHGSVTLLQADRKSTRLNSSHVKISYAVFCL